MSGDAGAKVHALRVLVAYVGRRNPGRERAPRRRHAVLATKPVTTPVTTSTPSTKPLNLDNWDAAENISTARPRLRALWTLWSVEVRVLWGALEKPRTRGGGRVRPRTQKRHQVAATAQVRLG
jgi:hypothetical protein